MIGRAVVDEDGGLLPARRTRSRMAGPLGPELVTTGKGRPWSCRFSRRWSPAVWGRLVSSTTSAVSPMWRSESTAPSIGCMWRVRLVEEAADQFRDLRLRRRAHSVSRWRMLPLSAKLDVSSHRPWSADVVLEIAGEMHDHLVDVADDEGAAGEAQGLELAQGDVRNQWRLPEVCGAAGDAFRPHLPVPRQRSRAGFRRASRWSRRPPRKAGSAAEARIAATSRPGQVHEALQTFGLGGEKAQRIQGEDFGFLSGFWGFWGAS